MKNISLPSLLKKNLNNNFMTNNIRIKKLICTTLNFKNYSYTMFYSLFIAYILKNKVKLVYTYVEK